MYKIIILIFSILLLAGCGTPRERIVYQDKYIPIPVVPPPPEIIKPVFYINGLSELDKQNIGVLSKAYVISAKQAMAYIDQLLIVYNLYEKLSALSKDRLDAIEKMGKDIDKSLINQFDYEIESLRTSMNEEINKLHADNTNNINYLLESRE